MALAIFDLDNTLIAGDSDYLWGEFMAANGLVNEQKYRESNDYFYQQYEQGTLDIHEYLNFCLEPLTRYSLEELKEWHDRFMSESIRPIMLKKAHERIARHRQKGDLIMIITATSRFVTEPIARELQVDTLLAIEPEIRDSRYTGAIVGTPTYQEGKVIRLQQWLEENPAHSLKGSHFYSDSQNDLPLLQQVDHPVAVDPDPELEKAALNKGWPVISFR